jgi:hypothetical protein
MPPLAKPMDQLLKPSLEKENMSEKILARGKLNTEEHINGKPGLKPNYDGYYQMPAN